MRVSDVIKEEPLWVPPNFEEWLKENIKERYIFIKNTKKGCYDGWCECGEHIALEGVKAGLKITCPICNKKATARYIRHNKVSVRSAACYISERDDGFVEDLYVVNKFVQFQGDEFNGSVDVRITTTHEQRNFFQYKDNKCYPYHKVRKYGYFDGWNCAEHWKAGPGIKHGMGYSGWRVEDLPLSIYNDNVDEILDGTVFRYSMAQEAVRLGWQLSFYLRKYMKYPKLELLLKAGLYKLVDQLMSEYDWGEYSASIIDYELSRKGAMRLYHLNTKEDWEECRWLPFSLIQARAVVKCWNDKSVDELAARSFIKALIFRCGDDFEYDFISNKALFKYYQTQKDYEGKESNFIADYTDYIGECVHLGYDLNDTAISKPKNFKVMHDNMMDIKEFNASHCYDIAVEAAYINLHELVEYEAGKYSIKMAKTCDEIIQEGKALKHCVARYCERVAKSESVILFVREKADPERPFYTMEIKPDMKQLDIVQCRGLENRAYPEEIAELLDKYEKWFNNRKIKSFDSSKLYATYYKSVQKIDGRYYSIHDKKTEYHVGTIGEVDTNEDPDEVHVKGMHIASLAFAQKFAGTIKNAAILEVKVNIHDVIIPNAKDQVRCKRWEIVREVPYEELGEWGAERLKNNNAA